MGKRKERPKTAKASRVILMGREQIAMSDFLIEFEKQYGNILITCLVLKMNRDTYYEWRKRNKWFKEQTDRIKKKADLNLDDIAEGSLISLLQKKNVPITIFYLKTRHRKYRPTLDVDLGGEVQVEHKLSAADQALLAKAITYGVGRTANKKPDKETAKPNIPKGTGKK